MTDKIKSYLDEYYKHLDLAITALEKLNQEVQMTKVMLSELREKKVLEYSTGDIIDCSTGTYENPGNKH